MTRPDLAELRLLERDMRNSCDLYHPITAWADRLAAALRKMEQDSAATGAQDMVPCRHEVYHGACVHCDVPFVDGRPKYLERAAPAPRGVTDSGKLWSFLRNVLEQGRSIQMDNAAGKYETYEYLSARIDEAARERADELEAALAAEQKEGKC